MLAKIGSAPFDSDRHLFEIKWDGFRVLAFAEDAGRVLRSRRGQDLTPRFPELDFLAELPSGTVLDGELVILREGRPDLSALQSRQRRPGSSEIREPATFVAFDLLFERHTSLLVRPLRERRERLRRLLASGKSRSVVLSEGIVGAGRQYFEEVCDLGLEGVMAKDLSSHYLPGRRSDAWQKWKRRHAVHCAILGYVPKGANDFESLVVATDRDGVLGCVGKVGSGFTDADRETLLGALKSRTRREPLVPSDEAARWVEPGLYCTVQFLEWLPSGRLRAPVFRGLLGEDGAPLPRPARSPRSESH